MLKEIYHVAVPTAFQNDETLDTKRTLDHIRKLYNKGIRSVLVCGSTGEQHSLSLKEKVELLTALEEEELLVSDMEIIFGVSAIRQSEAEVLAKEISKTSIAAILLGYPPYLLPTQSEALVYSKSIISLAKKPVILYNNPARTGFDLSVESILELAKSDSVIGLKEAGNPSKASNILRNLSDGAFYLYAGGERDLSQKIQYGFSRLSSIAGNLAPIKIQSWFEDLLSGNIIEQEKLDSIHDVLEIIYNGSPIVNLKRELSHEGVDLGKCRRPLGNS
ncbi:dihydrodipicolinate synthase family protein [Terribacillus saccharophilus]|uniref:Dihydrodipicolinate synthase family protein n=1 Tax=Terribacillus saccharophilus TaxID=361277 RepID=A0A268A8Y8_9BACI|nr:dihydrodipicolinate synthase family protein [Terribacillus saccharophilus]PAD20585.1 dihydrodipicolinate synthase family protein [Terribacillus saccharophilus]PAF17771.1 dihydrodipicolinate synthase family protein [Terribacillus saccharophilus]PAF34824.1 dihydrodipicolinate synthase family protein [Terribacillus saccharophilus]PAF39119.1 dihydrodipicolinate synthase family protein [Terribacillus saccharophilus]